MQAQSESFCPLPITAAAVVSACGIGKLALKDALLSNRCCLTPSSLLDLDFLAHVGEVSHALPEVDTEFSDYSTRNTRLALAAIEDEEGGFRTSVEQAKRCYGANRIGVVIGTSTSGMLETEQAYGYRKREGKFPAYYHFEHQHAWIATAEFIRLSFGLGGPCYTVSTACSSGSKSIAAAGRMIRTGVCDAVVAGGIDSLCQLTLNGFNSLELIAPSRCTPLDRNRQGISIGEAAGLLLVEKPDIAFREHVHLLGWGESSDAHHMTAPHPTGRGAIQAMRQALRLSGLKSSDIHYVNLHATGTQQNDLAEMRAMHEVFGDASCSATKGIMGHTLGAAGALEAIICIQAIQGRFLPGTCGLNEVDPDLPHTALVDPKQDVTVDIAMSNNFAFGGNNSSLILGYPRGR